MALASSFFSCGSQARAMSIEDETIVGNKFLESIRRQFPMAEDDFANDYLNDLGQYLAKNLETEPFPFTFYVLQNNDVNAFAGPGGHIFFYTGLIMAMDDADELAAVLCHEMGHVAARHLSNRIEQNKKIAIATLAGMLAGALIGGKAAGAVMTGSAAAGIQQQLNYSRDDERQADQLGFKYMNLSGFDPGGMVSMLKKLEKMQWQGANAVPSYLLTHPGGSERILNTESMMTSYEASKENREVRKFRKLFPYLKMTIVARYAEPQEAERFLKRVSAGSPDSQKADYGYGLLWKEKEDYGKAIEFLEKASREDPTFLPILRDLGEAYQLKGQDKQAIAVLERAMRINDQDKATLFLMAVSYQNLEDFDKAILFYERLASMKPVKDEVYHNLGVSYGRKGTLALAHYNFGIYFSRIGEMRNAKFHFQKSEELAANDPALKNRIRQAAESLRAKEKKSVFD
jgi:predicted Zn-dependent protease